MHVHFCRLVLALRVKCFPVGSPLRSVRFQANPLAFHSGGAKAALNLRTITGKGIFCHFWQFRLGIIQETLPELIVKSRGVASAREKTVHDVALDVQILEYVDAGRSAFVVGGMFAAMDLLMRCLRALGVGDVPHTLQHCGTLSSAVIRQALPNVAFLPVAGLSVQENVLARDVALRCLGSVAATFAQILLL